MASTQAVVENEQLLRAMIKLRIRLGHERLLVRSWCQNPSQLGAMYAAVNALYGAAPEVGREGSER